MILLYFSQVSMQNLIQSSWATTLGLVTPYDRVLRPW